MFKKFFIDALRHSETILVASLALAWWYRFLFVSKPFNDVFVAFSIMTFVIVVQWLVRHPPGAGRKEPSCLQLPDDIVDDEWLGIDINGYWATELQYYKAFAGFRHLPETIARSAIYLPHNKLVYSVDKPGRHHHVIQLIKNNVSGVLVTTDQGFITSHGRYVRRKEAALIAREAKQLIREPTPHDMLTSEDVWASPPRVTNGT